MNIELKRKQLREAREKLDRPYVSMSIAEYDALLAVVEATQNYCEGREPYRTEGYRKHDAMIDALFFWGLNHA